VGGWANNGFDEKRKIIIDIFSKFKDSGLKCGFFVNKNLTHQQECDLLRNSKLTLNIHDAYQRSLGLDTNERTFKSLGLNGALVSDTVGQLGRLFPEVKTSLDANEIVEITRDLLNLNPSDLEEIKSKNKDDILANHCYTNRIQELVKL
jgi:spore maturation protein CgeB